MRARGLLLALLATALLVCVPAAADEGAQGGDTNVGTVNPESEDAPTEEEMEGINKIVQDTGVMKILQKQTEEHQEKLDKLHVHIEDKLAGIRKAFDDLHSTMLEKEDKIEKLLQQIEGRVIDKFRDTVTEGTATKHNWILPFVLIVVVLGGLVVAGCLKYRQMIKSHLL
eukprot:g822.t1